MGKKQSPAETLRKAKEKDSGRDTGIVNGKPSFRELEPGTKKNYQRQLDLWHGFVRQNPGASPYDLHSLQTFVREMAYAIDGAEGIKEAYVETVRKNWNAFTAVWRRANPESPEIPRGITRSVTNFIKGPLAEEIGLTKGAGPCGCWAATGRSLFLGFAWWYVRLFGFHLLVNAILKVSEQLAEDPTLGRPEVAT